MALLAELGEGIASVAEQRIRALLRRLRLGNGFLDCRDLFASRTSLRIRGFGGALRLDPTCMKQPGFNLADLVADLAIALGRARLSAKRRRALFLITQYLGQPRQIGLG